ncbi:L,D-transpeptidase family protein [Blastococcus sp. PRF04-17]|uniref:L,D-transpeptidase family protein n=1 Tax=Blastococcus sp. PRF04-17 TaxID=2933797 RepID=UPI001FF48875|nr:L,D-transpeptidase family protein [Blastococcus sp. PRF04-17]UOY01114.1 hypothetical protein MVA48_19480 [Blastococcus sp. PRF04-17]
MRSALLRAFLVLLCAAGVVALSVTAPVAAAEPAVLAPGQQLGVGQNLRSSDGAYRLTVQPDGNVVLYAADGRAVWNTGTARSGATRLVMQSDGNLVLYGTGAVWNSRTSGNPGARVALQVDGNLVVYSATNRALWSSGPDRGRPVAAVTGDTLLSGRQLLGGQTLFDRDGSYRLAMQTDGNAVVRSADGRVVWNSGTAGRSGSRLLMQPDGNLVLYTPAGSAVWQSRTAGHPGARAVLQRDGNFVVYASDGRPLWNSGPDRRGLPLLVATGSSSQVVTVTVTSATSTTGRLTAWEKRGGSWVAVLGPFTARVGSQGIGQAREGLNRTPAGTYTLTESFGRQANPGTGLPYRVIDGNDWWVSDVNSTLYNRYTRCARGTCPFDEAAGENLWAQGTVYDYATVIDYNRAGTRGAGSAFFLHVTNGSPTAGCVAIDRASLVSLMRWLRPASAPLVSIGVG